MIPTIGVMIGGYIMFRCIELACRSKSNFANSGVRAVVIVLAVIGVLITGFLTIDLARNGGFGPHDLTK